MTETILLLALKSLLVAAVTLGLLRLTRARSAAERSTIAHLGLFALVALPLGSLALPSLALPVPAPMARFAAIDPGNAERLSAPLPRSTEPSAETPITPVQPSVSDDTAGPSFAQRLAGAAWYAFLLPTLLLLGVTMAALLRLVGLRRRADVLVDPEWLSALARAQRRMGFKNGTALLWSDELGSPVSWGLMRPVILLNNAAVAAPEQAEAIIAHELAHVVHLDWAKLILARVATATFWFNPLAWVLAREAHQLREESADDAVLAANIAGPDYAELLIGVARHQCRGALLGAHGVAPSKSSLGRRVRRVLDQSPARGPSGRSWVAGFATGMLSMAVPLAAITLVPTHNAIATAETPRQGSRPPAITTPGHVQPVATAGDARTALASAPAADPMPQQTVGTPQPSQANRSDDDDDTSDGPAGLGVSVEYRRAMAAAGFPNLSLDQLNEARGGNVSPEYARAMRATGMHLSIDDLIAARGMNLSAPYVAAMRRLGIDGTLDDYQGMRAVGVSVEFVGKLRKRGINTTSPEKLTELRASGADPDPDPDP